MPEPKEKRVSPAKITNTGIPTQLQKSSIYRKYRLTSVLKRDFAGVMYRTETKSGGKQMAVKVLSPGYFVSSNTLLGNIDHSRICKIWDSIIEKDGTQAVVLEEPSGKSVSDLMAESGPLSAGEAVSATLQLLSALHAVHWNNTVVGNLHSESVFLSRDEHGNMELQLVNFGIGCRDLAQREPHYLSPEQVSQPKASDKRSDVWAAGVLFYEMLFGKRPFNGANQYEIAGEILLKEPVFHDQWTNLPDDLVAILKKALAKNPDHRYENVTSMVADLLPFQEEFDEPISEAAANAIKESYPPKMRKEAEQKPGDRQPRLVQSISRQFKAISTLSSVSKKKTMLGIPTIELQQGQLGQANAGDTEDLVFDDFPQRPSETTASQGAQPSPAGPKKTSTDTRDLTPADEASDDGERKAFDLAKVREPLAEGETSRLVAVTIRELRDRSRGALASAQKFVVQRPKIAGFVAGSLVVLILLFAVLAGDGDHSEAGGAGFPESSSETRGAAPEGLDERKSSDVESSNTEGGADGNKEEIAEKNASPETVTIRLLGAPEDAEIEVDGKPVEQLPIRLTPSTRPVTVHVEAEGYEPYSAVVVPNEPREVKVELVEEKSKRRRGAKRSKRKAKSQPKKTAGSDDDLATNPFPE